jgi:hypothetical protein
MTWAPNLKKARPLLGMISLATVHHGLHILGQMGAEFHEVEIARRMVP